MEIKEALTLVRQKVSTRATWTQKAWARDAEGTPVLPGDPSACRWCLIGAILAEFSTNPEFPYWMDVQDYLYEHLGRLGEFNDTHGLPEILEELDGIIEAS